MTARRDRHLSVERASAYLDGQVTPEERQQIEHHLRTCPQCAWQVESLRQTVSLLHQVRRVAVPRPLTLREVDVQPARAKPRRSWVLPYLQGATALVSLLLAFLVAGDLFLGLGRVPKAMPAAQPAPVVATAPVEKAAQAERAVPQPTQEVAMLEAPATPVPEAMAATALPAAGPGPEGETVPSGEAVGGGAGEEAVPAPPSPAVRMRGEGVAETPTPTMKALDVEETAQPTAGAPVAPAPQKPALPTPALAPTEVAMAPEVPTATPEAAPLAAVATPSPIPLPAPAVEAARVAPGPWVPWIRLAELGLLGLALVLGGLTLLLRQR